LQRRRRIEGGKGRMRRRMEVKEEERVA